MSLKKAIFIMIGFASFNAYAENDSSGANHDGFQKFAYVANFAANTVSVCKIDKSSGALTNCVATNGGAGTGANGQTGFSGPTGVSILGRFAYVTNATAQTISSCLIDFETGGLSNCVATNGGTGAGANGLAGFNGPSGIASFESYTK